MRLSELNEGGDCKTYLIVAEKTGEAALVDPLLNRVPIYLKLLRAEGLQLRYVVDTHTHADHLSGCADLMDRLGAEYVMGRGALPTCARRRLAHGETISFGEARLDFLETPGHTTDSASILTDGALLSGDFLFIGDLAAGRLDLPGGDPTVHYESLKRLDALSDATRLLPGHDYQGKVESTLGAERRINPVLIPRTREAYGEWWAAKKFGPAAWMTDVVRANRHCTRDPHAVAIPSSTGTCAAVCAAVPTHKDGVPQIAPRDLALLLADKDLKKIPFVLDVRTAEEFENDGHIPGSVLIPHDQIPQRHGEVPANRSIAIVCRSGGRATLAAGNLRAHGFQNIWVLTGGFTAWRQAGYGASV